MKANIIKLIVVTTIATLLTACGTTGTLKQPQTATPQPQPAPSTRQEREQRVLPDKATGVAITDDAGKDVTTSKVTAPLKARNIEDAGPEFWQHLLRTKQQEYAYQEVVQAFEAVKNIDATAKHFSVPDPLKKALVERIAPDFTEAGPKKGPAATGSTTAKREEPSGVRRVEFGGSDSSMAQYREFLEFQRYQEEAKRYRAKGF